MATGALESRRKAHPHRCALVARRGQEDDLIGLAVAGFNRIHDAGTHIGTHTQPVGEDVDRRGIKFLEIQFQQRLRRGELHDAAVLKEPVVTAGAQLGQPLLQPVGDVDHWWGARLRRGFGGLFIGKLFRFRRGGRGCGHRIRCRQKLLHRLQDHLAALDGEQRVDMGAFFQCDQSRGDFVNGIPLHHAAAVQASDRAAARI